MNDIGVITLTNGGFTLVPADLFGVLNTFTWKHDKKGYIIRRVTVAPNTRKVIRLHRVINGTPAGMETDHRNRVRFDNMPRNLRSATITQNKGNVEKRRDSSGPYKGVRRVWKSATWQARICKNGVAHHIGNFATAQEAAEAYNKAALELFGEFANLNHI